jgi:hypothetical protein
MARPYLEAMTAVPSTLRMGIHIRMGDSALANTFKKGDKRYQPGCAVHIITPRSASSVHTTAAAFHRLGNGAGTT